MITGIPLRGSIRSGEARPRPGEAQDGSVFDRKPLPHFVDPLVQRIEARVQGAVVQVEDVAERREAEDPVMGLDIVQHRFDRMANEGKDTQHHVHRISPGGFDVYVESSISAAHPGKGWQRLERVRDQGRRIEALRIAGPAKLCEFLNPKRAGRAMPFVK